MGPKIILFSTVKSYSNWFLDMLNKSWFCAILRTYAQILCLFPYKICLDKKKFDKNFFWDKKFFGLNFFAQSRPPYLTLWRGGGTKNLVYRSKVFPSSTLSTEVLFQHWTQVSAETSSCCYYICLYHISPYFWLLKKVYKMWCNFYPYYRAVSVRNMKVKS